MNTTFCSTLCCISDFLKHNHSGELLDKNLNVGRKNFFHRVIGLFSPFATFLGCDVYSHVRVHAVAKAVFDLCKQNEDILKNRPELIVMVQERIIDRLNLQTSGKYKESLDSVRESLESLVPRKEIELGRFSIPDGNLDETLLPYTFKRLAQIQSDHELEDFKRNLNEMIARLSSRMFKFSSGKREFSLLEANSDWNQKDFKIVSQYSYRFPCCIRPVLQNGSLINIVFVFKATIQGGRACYNIVEKQPLVYKKHRDGVHGILIEKISGRGLSIPLFLTKTHFFEPLSTTLETHILRGAERLTLSQKISIMEDLLAGLAKLHEIEMPISWEPRALPEKAYRWSKLLRQRTYCSTNDFKTAHTNLNFSNILIQKKGRLYTAQITGFHQASPLLYNEPLNPALSSAFKMAKKPATNLFDQIEWYGDYQQKEDVWSMGMILSVILSGRDHLPIQYTVNSTQAQIDESLGLLESEDADLVPLWQIVRQMLRIDPNRRILAAEAFKQILKRA